jgi:ribosomal protein S2
MNITDIRKQIKKLKRLKKDLRSGSKERIKIFRQIQELKEQLKGITVIDKDKQPLIEEIHRIDPLIEKIALDLTKFSKAELQKHIDRIKSEKRN